MPRKKVTQTVPSGPLRYALYRRVSTPGQAERDLSLPEQARQQREYVAANGGYVVADFEDAGISGKTAEDRPQFMAMIEAARRREFDILLIHKSDRSFRNRFDAVVHKVMLRKLGIAMRSVTERWFGGDDPSDKLTEGILEVLQEYHSDNLATEVRKGITSKARHKGQQWGPIPYGYQRADGGGWAIDKDEAPWVQWIFDQRARREPKNEICRQMNAMGIRPPGHQRGALAYWHVTTLTKILRSHAYIGEVKLRGEWFPGVHTPLVEQGLWRRVQEIEGEQCRGRADRSPALFAGGFLRCPLCRANHIDSVLTVGYSSTSVHAYYRCSRQNRQLHLESMGAPVENACPGFMISEPRLISLLAAYLRARTAAIHTRKAKEKTAPHREQKQIAAVQRELDGFPAIRAAFQLQQARNLMTLDELAAQLAAITERESVLRRVIEESAITKEEATASLTIADARRLLAALEGTDTPQDKRVTLREAIEIIVPWPNKTGLDIYLRSQHADFEL